LVPRSSGSRPGGAPGRLFGGLQFRAVHALGHLGLVGRTDGSEGVREAVPDVLGVEVAVGVEGELDVRVPERLLCHRRSCPPHDCRAEAVASVMKPDMSGDGLGPGRGLPAARARLRGCAHRPALPPSATPGTAAVLVPFQQAGGGDGAPQDLSQPEFPRLHRAVGLREHEHSRGPK